MDPVTALGLTCNVLQLVETGYKGLALCWRLYKRGEDVGVSDLREICESLDKSYQLLRSLLQNALSPSMPDDSDLVGLCIKCQAISSELLEELRGLVLPVKSNVLSVLGKALKSSTKAGRIERLTSELEGLGKVLDSRILISTYALLKQSNVDLQGLNKNLDQRSRELLKAITAGQLHVDALLSDNALACQKLIEREHRVTRNHIDDAHASLIEAVNNDGSSTRARLDSFTTQFDVLKLDDRRRDLFKSILQTLEYPEIFSRPENISEPHRETCDWVFAQRPFTDWLEGTDQLFWIQGKAGSGKSTLMHFMAEDEDGKVQRGLNKWTQNQPVKVLSFYFWESGTELQRSTEGLFRSLLYQILNEANESQDLMQTFLSMRDVTDIGDSSKHLTTKLLTRLFPEVATRSQRHLCIFLDGLDEFSEDEEILDLLDALRGSQQIKLCASSRSSPDFEDYFVNHSKLRVHDLTAPAIEKYVRDKLIQDKRLRQLMSKDDRSTRELLDKIVASAEGVFLWVELVVKDLIRGLRNKDDLATLQKRAERRPKKISDLYEAMWNRAKVDHDIYEEEAALYFGLAMQRSQHELSHSPLVFALAQDNDLRARCLDSISDDTIPWLGLDLDRNILLTRIQTCSAGLLEAQPRTFPFSGYGRAFPDVEFDFDSAATANLIEWNAATMVTFMHKTAREFVESSPTMRSLLSSHNKSQQHERRATESRILTWGLTLMRLTCDRIPLMLDREFDALPDIPDEEAALPMVSLLEALLNRISRRNGIDWEYFRFRVRQMSRGICSYPLPNGSHSRGHHIVDMVIVACLCDPTDEVDSFDFLDLTRCRYSLIVYWLIGQQLLYNGLVNLAQCTIESRGYPRDLFTGLLGLYEPRTWLGKSLLCHLLANGADLERHLCFDDTTVPSPSLTIMHRILFKLFLTLIRYTPGSTRVIAEAELILEHNANRIPCALPVLNRDRYLFSQLTVYTRLPFDVGLSTLLRRREIVYSEAETATFLDMVKRAEPDRTRRAYALQLERTVWPINSETSALFFDELFDSPHVRESSDTYTESIAFANRLPFADATSWFFRKVMSEGEPFATLEDAYRHMGWTEADLARYYEPMKGLGVLRCGGREILFGLQKRSRESPLW